MPKPRQQPQHTDSPRGAALLSGAAATRVALLAILAASLFLRCQGLSLQGLECEELYTIPAATGHQYVYLHREPGGARPAMPLSTAEYRRLLEPEAGRGLGAVKGVLARNVHLPLYFFVMHYWVRAAGTSASALRLPSALWGTLSVLFIFLLGRELFSTLAGLVAAMLMGLLPEQIYFAQQARMYTLLVLLAVASTYALVLTRRAAGWTHVLYAALSALGLYAHYEYAFFFAAQTLFVWCAPGFGRARKKAWLLAQGAAALAFAPWLFVALLQREASGEVIAWAQGDMSAAALAAAAAGKLTRLISAHDAPLGVLSALLGYALLGAGLWALRARRAELLLLGLWIVLPLACVLLLDLALGTHALSITRYWLLITPALYLLMAEGFTLLRPPKLRVAAALAVVLLLAPAAYQTGRGRLRPKPDRHGEMARFLEQQTDTIARPTFLIEGSNAIPLALAYYGRRDAAVIRYKWLVDQMPQRGLDELLGGASEVWLLVSGDAGVARLLEEGGFRRSSVQVLVGHVLISRYSKPSVQAAARPEDGRAAERRPH